MVDWHPQPAHDLPDGLVLFDGACAMCDASVRFIVPRDPQGRFRFVPLQSELGLRLAMRFGIDPDAPQSNMVVRGGRAWFKSDAALAVAADLAGWQWARPAWLLPRRIRNAAYDLLASNRNRWFGGPDRCQVAPPAVRSRILTAPEDLA